VSPVKQSSPSTTNETPSSEWPGVASLDPQAAGLDGACRDLDAVPLDELVVARDMVGVAVCQKQVGRREPMALNGGDERLERRAAVDEHGLSSLPCGQEIGVREPGGMEASLDEHPKIVRNRRGLVFRSEERRVAASQAIALV
jgi:hypothetical protein